ncbi:MAG: DUF6778 family protein [Paracoccaceae bacterium]
MTLFRSLLILSVAVGLSGCATSQPASRAAQPDPSLSATPAMAQRDGTVVMQPKYRVTEVRVAVPRTLTVSEASTFRPNADIVWRGEARGDRHAQVTQIFNEALLTGTAGMTTGPDVVVDVVVTRFHGVTEKTRYTIGGLYSMRFDLTVRDAATGTVLDGPRKVIADVQGAGGAAAIAEDQAGRTEKMVVLERLSEVIRLELSGSVTGPAADAILSSRSQTNTAVTKIAAGL